MYALTAAQLAALTANGVTVTRLAQVCDTYGNVLAAIPVTAGQVQENETTGVRWTCSLTVNDTSLVPGQIGDLLHPLTGNELRIYKGVGDVMVPMGVYRMTQPDTTDTNASIGTVLTGNDRSAEISRRAWTAPYDASGMTVEAVIADVLNEKWTGAALQMNLYPSGVVVPTGTVLGQTYTSSGWTAESGSTSGANDPWADLVALAKSAACELFWNRVGIPTMRPVPQIGTLPVATALWQEGANCTVTEMQRKLDDTEFRNGVQVVGTGATVTNPADGSVSPGAPVYAEAWSTDPLLGPAGPLGARPEQITDPTISTTQDAQNRANAELALIMSTLDDTSLAGVDLYWIDCGDTVPVSRARMKVNAGYVPQIITHPLDLGSNAQVTFRPFSIAA